MLAALSTLEELEVWAEPLEAAEALLGDSDVLGVESTRLETIVRLLLHLHSCPTCPTPSLVP